MLEKCAESCTRQLCGSILGAQRPKEYRQAALIEHFGCELLFGAHDCHQLPQRRRVPRLTGGEM